MVLFFVFLTLSAVVSVIQELIAQVFQVKSGNLKKCVGELLKDNHYGKRLEDRFFRHPAVTSLSGRARAPTHIEPEIFVRAMATAIQPEWSKGDPVAALPASIDALQDGQLKDRLRIALAPIFADDTTPEKNMEAAKAWFATAEDKMTDRFKADSRGRLYTIAAVVTVLFNVSPIEIAKRLMQDDTLRTSFASAVPELTTFVFNSGQGLPIATAGNEAPALQKAAEETTVGPAATPAAAAAGVKLSGGQVQTMLALFHCSRNELSLPIGWPWMASLLNKAETSKAGALLGGATGGQQSCDNALASAGADPDLRGKLTLISSARPAGVSAADGGAQSFTATPFTRQFGPSFATENPMVILLGWMIAVFAGAQGAPFWFDLLKKVLKR